jgi:hypothetical protein
VSLLYRSRPRTLVRCFAICTLYGCSIELCGKICKSGEGMSLFSLAARRRSLECWLRARSRALTPMRSVDTRRWTRPTTPSYLHTCHLHMHRKESSVSPTCSYRIYQDTANRLVASLSIRRTRHPTDSPSDGLAIRACCTSPSHCIENGSLSGWVSG